MIKNLGMNNFEIEVLGANSIIVLRLISFLLFFIEHIVLWVRCLGSPVQIFLSNFEDIFVNTHKRSFVILKSMP